MEWERDIEHCPVEELKDDDGYLLHIDGTIDINIVYYLYDIWYRGNMWWLFLSSGYEGKSELGVSIFPNDIS